MAAQDTIRALRARVTDLEAEVVRLKRELATRGAAVVPTRELAAVGVGKCGHGQFCQAIACRAAR